MGCLCIELQNGIGYLREISHARLYHSAQILLFLLIALLLDNIDDEGASEDDGGFVNAVMLVTTPR